MDDTARSRIRRQRSLSPGRALRGTPTSTTSKSSRMMAIGSFLVSSMFKIKLQRKSDATAKKKFQVNVPTRLLSILGLVFLLIPVLVFLYKEAHIHEDRHKAHYHAEKFVNVDSKHAMAHFLDNHNETTKTSSNDEEDHTIHSEGTHGNSTKTMLRHNTRHSFHNSTEER